ncbi:MAG: NitT/TauT family transport system ATP-binding protein [Candidatus Eremiobacteraeota bacterium]|jgi:NitT/TauT family transport system ATP-binding protein|nr:NitT/TauT family transport system ATP-binding protein [Candidatus Eremiobacteraeota bacterium]
MPAAKICFEDVEKRFALRDGEHVALGGVSFDVRAGEFFVIVGPSGCGKTTLLRIAAGLEKPTAGRVTIAHGDSDRPENAMVFQGESIFPWMTVRQNASYGLKMRGATESHIEEVVGHYLDRTGLRKFADAFPHQLSGGMKQRVSIARAFACDPEVLLMDEPFSALDEQNRTLLQEELLRIWDETKKTVVFITHSVDEAVTLGDRIMIMGADRGRPKAFVDVPFARPRSVLDLRATPEYGRLFHDIWAQLRDEIRFPGAEPAA